MSTSLRCVVEKFDGQNSCSICKLKMRAVLVTSWCSKSSTRSISFSEFEKDDTMEKAHSATQLNFSDEVLHEVAKVEVVDQLRKKLEVLYMRKASYIQNGKRSFNWKIA